MTKEQEVLKDLKKVTLEELDEAIKAVDKQEQEEAIEYFKKHIKYFEDQIKFIEATDCDYYDEELELYQNRIKQFNTILSMLEEKDKIIEQMTYYIMNLDIDEDICKRVNCDTNSGELDCKDCIKQYFENKVTDTNVGERKVENGKY